MTAIPGDLAPTPPRAIPDWHRLTTDQHGWHWSEWSGQKVRANQYPYAWNLRQSGMLWDGSCKRFRIL